MNDYSNFRHLRPLSDEDMQRLAPSVFASAPHESRSARYTYIPTLQLIAGMREAGFFPVSVMQSRCRIPGKQPFTKHMVRFARELASPDSVELDDTIPQVCLKNSHDGSSAYELGLGLFRPICKNGLMVSTGSFEEVKVPHKGNVMRDVIEGAFTVIQSADKVLQHATSWKHLQLTGPEQHALAHSALMLRFDGSEEQPPKVTEQQILAPRRDSDRGSDLWATFNRLQENVIRGGQRYIQPGHRTEEGRYIRSRRMQTRPVGGIDQSTTLNRALWALAERMAELKQTN
jgi:hypothetical protein